MQVTMTAERHSKGNHKNSQICYIIMRIQGWLRLPIIELEPIVVRPVTVHGVKVRSVTMKFPESFYFKTHVRILIAY
jgi:hypothetical protein